MSLFALRACALAIPIIAPALFLSGCEAASGATPSFHASKGGTANECHDCPEFVAIAGAARFGFAFASRNEITWREYGQAVRERDCAPPLAVPERLDPGKRRKLRASAADPRFETNVAVTGLSAADVQCYIAWLDSKTGQKHSLPTPAQWRFLAYGSAKTAYPWGESLGHNRALIGNAFDNDRYQKEGFTTAAVAPRAVGQLAPNLHGLNDVIGNAAELTSDCRKWTPKRPVSELYLSCAVLGGSTISTPEQQSKPDAPLRVIISQSYPDAYVGFRLVR